MGYMVGDDKQLDQLSAEHLTRDMDKKQATNIVTIDKRNQVKGDEA